LSVGSFSAFGFFLNRQQLLPPPLHALKHPPGLWVRAREACAEGGAGGAGGAGTEAGDL